MKRLIESQPLLDLTDKFRRGPLPQNRMRHVAGQDFRSDENKNLHKQERPDAKNQPLTENLQYAHPKSPSRTAVMAGELG